jgi:solute carrier family 25 (peroxisomal adenine nucleotide transporter), member 17
MTSTLPPLVQAISGSLGSAAANSLVYPLDLVTTRLQTSRSKHTGLSKAVDILVEIVGRHGFGALYDGVDTDTAATLLSK